ncbi:MAG: hypothetical protein RL260_897 [Pseudomonadota bacterium]|jgi:hypothetical protein
MRQTLPSSLLLRLSLLLPLLLAMLLMSPVQAQPAQDWEQVAAEMVQRPEFAALPLQIQVLRERPGRGSPAEMQLQSGQCILHLRTRDNPLADILLAQAAPEDRTLWLQAVIVHEFAHCWRWQGDDPAMQQLVALMGTASTDARAARQVQHQLGREESFADVAALAWVAQVAPQRLVAILGAFQRLRGNTRLSTGPHDTRAALARVQREGFTAHLPLFLAAEALLDAAAE